MSKSRKKEKAIERILLSGERDAIQPEGGSRWRITFAGRRAIETA